MNYYSNMHKKSSTFSVEDEPLNSMTKISQTAKRKHFKTESCGIHRLNNKSSQKGASISTVF